MIGIGNTAIACAKSCIIQVKSKTIEVSSATTGDWREYVAGSKEWSINVGYFVESGQYGNIGDTSIEGRLRLAGQTVTLSVFTTVNGQYIRAVGTAICTDANVSATKGNLVYGDWKFKGTGELEFG